MTRSGRIILGLLALLYAGHLLLRSIGYSSPEWINSYLGDLLCMPILLSCTLLALRAVKGLPYFQFTHAQIVFAVLYVSLVFEYLLPHFSDRYTSDPIDVSLYVLGGLMYMLLQDHLFLSLRPDVHPHSKSTS